MINLLLIAFATAYDIQLSKLAVILALDQSENMPILIEEEPITYSWPLTGKIIDNFGENIFNSKFKTDYTIIHSTESKIKASASGEVIYAEWLPELGLTIIIDHGNSYHSIYGKCDRLLVQKGQRISKNQEIAYFNNNTQNHELFFAIKHKGKSIAVKKLIH